MVREKADRILNDVLDAATLGTVDTGPASARAGAGATGDLEGEAVAPKRPARSTDGGGRSRTRAASTSAPTG